MDVKNLLGKKMDRRRVLGNLGMMGAGAVLTACGTGVVGQDPDPDPEPRNFDPAILNFALNLEYLEAAFYLAAVGRIGELPGGNANVILPSGFDGTSMMPFDNLSIQEYAQEIAQDELDHVEFLRAALSNAGAPVAERPVIDLAGSFQAAATAAFSVYGNAAPPPGFTPDQFNPFAAEIFFLHGAFIFEDVGVTAYKGAARYLTNKDFLEAAAGILAVEAYHAGEVRTVLYASDGRANEGTLENENNPYGAVPIWNIVKAISDARDSLDGTSDLDQGIVGAEGFGTAAHGGSNIVPTDSNAITFSRTPRQVAAIVYLNADVQAGGFFPNGINTAGLDDDYAILLSPDFPNNLDD